MGLPERGLDTGGNGPVLTRPDGPAKGRRVEIARLDADAITVEPDGAVSIPAKITLDGMMILGDHYPPGTVLDPVRLAPA